jgi:hypothetical protein
MEMSGNSPETQQSRRLHPGVVGASVVLALVLAAGTAFAAKDDISKLAQSLADLRTEVEELSSEVETKKSSIQSRVRSIQSQKADVEMQIQKEQMRLKQLNREMDKHKERVEQQKSLQKNLQPTVVESIDIVRSKVEDGLPFKRSERLNELDELEQQMKDGTISPQKATSRLWTFVEDELRLARENGLYRQVVQVDGEETLADVARVGMIAIYYKTEKGQVGMAVETSNGWEWREVEGEEETKKIRKLFEQFKKNIRVGYFTLPNPFGDKQLEALNEGGQR